MTPLVASRMQILGAALLFSTGGAAIKACSLTSWQVASFRSGLAAIALLLVLPASRRIWEPRTLLVGAAYAATMVFYVGGNKLTTAANTIFLQSTAPLYVLLLGPWLLKERVRPPDLFLAATLGIGMVTFFLGSEPPLATAPDPFRGNLLGACAGVTWASTLLGLRWLGRPDAAGTEPAGAAVIAGNLIACLVCLPFAFPVESSRPLDWSIVAYLGLFQIGLAYVFVTRGVRRLPALEASLLLLSEPVLNTFWAWLIHAERPGPWSATGCAIVLVATLVGVVGRGRRQSG